MSLQKIELLAKGSVDNLESLFSDGCSVFIRLLLYYIQALLITEGGNHMLDEGWGKGLSNFQLDFADFAEHSEEDFFSKSQLLAYLQDFRFFYFNFFTLVDVIRVRFFRYARLGLLGLASCKLLAQFKGFFLLF